MKSRKRIGTGADMTVTATGKIANNGTEMDTKGSRNRKIHL